jgi:hypothetical protein
MEKIRHFARQHAFEFEPAEQIGLRLIRFCQLAGFRGSELGQKFCELSQLHQRGVRIIPEIPLGQGAKTRKLRVVLGEKSEIGCLDWRAAHRLDASPDDTSGRASPRGNSVPPDRIDRFPHLSNII